MPGNFCVRHVRNPAILLLLAGASLIAAAWPGSGAAATGSGTGADITPTIIHMATSETGWAVTPRLVAWTNDGGLQWRNVSPPGYPSNNPSGGYSTYFLGKRYAWYGFLRAAGKVIVEITTNSGRTWRQSRLSVNPLQYALDFDFVNPQRGWIFMQPSGANEGDLSHIVATTDGGMKWRRLTVGRAPRALLVGVQSRAVWYAVGSEDRQARSDPYLVTQDGGTRWKNLKLPVPVGMARATVSEAGSVFFNKQHVRVLTVTMQLGASPSVLVVYVSRDGGRTWSDKVLPTRGFALYSQPSPSSAWAAGNSTYLFHTTNLRRWSRQYPKPAIRPALLDFVSSTDGFALTPLKEGAGKCCRLWGTADAGSSWTPIVSRLRAPGSGR